MFCTPGRAHLSASSWPTASSSAGEGSASSLPMLQVRCPITESVMGASAPRCSAASVTRFRKGSPGWNLPRTGATPGFSPYPGWQSAFPTPFKSKSYMGFLINDWFGTIPSRKCMT